MFHGLLMFFKSEWPQKRPQKKIQEKENQCDSVCRCETSLKGDTEWLAVMHVHSQNSSKVQTGKEKKQWSDQVKVQDWKVWGNSQSTGEDQLRNIPGRTDVVVLTPSITLNSIIYNILNTRSITVTVCVSGTGAVTTTGWAGFIWALRECERATDKDTPTNPSHLSFQRHLSLLPLYSPTTSTAIPEY